MKMGVIKITYAGYQNSTSHIPQKMSLPMEVWRYGGMEVWRYGGMEVWRYGGMEVWRYGGMEVWRYGGMGVREGENLLLFLLMDILVKIDCWDGEDSSPPSARSRLSFLFLCTKKIAAP
jgi:hypothetical protein